MKNSPLLKMKPGSQWHKIALPLMLSTVFSGSVAMAQSDTSSIQKYVTLLGIPSATTAPNGVGFVQISTDLDGSAGATDAGTGVVVGFGFGDADRGIGFQISALANSSTQNFDNYGYFEFKVSKRLNFGEQPTFVGLTIDRVGGWGAAEDLDPSAALAFTRFSTLNASSTGKSYPVMMSAGIGSHITNNGEDPGVYLGAGVGLNNNLGISAAWSGDHVNLGTAFRFNRLPNVGVTLVLSDAFDQQASQQLELSVNWIFNTSRRR